MPSRIESINIDVINAKSLLEKTDLKITKEELKDKIELIKQRVYNVLNDFIISGDYVEYYQSKSILLKLKSDLNSLILTIQAKNADISISDDTEETRSLQGFLNKHEGEISLIIINGINSLINFIEGIEYKQKLSSNRIFLTKNDSRKTEEIIHDSDEFLRVFRLNLFIANCDHYFDINEKLLYQNLEYVIDYLNNYTGDQKKNTDLLFTKASFLRWKILFRKIEEKEIKTFINEITIKDGLGSLTKVNLNSFEIGLEDYKKFLTYSVNHYELVDYAKETIIANVNFEDSLCNASVLELHRYIKYYKDCTQDLNGLKSIRKEIERRYTEHKKEIVKYNLKPDFDLFALRICLSYCYNNEFSLICQLSNISNLDEVYKLYDDIDRNPALKDIKNYFTTAKLFQFIVDLNDKRYKEILVSSFQKGSEIELRKITKNLQRAEELYEKYSRDSLWIRENYNYVFQLPKNECFVQDNQLGEDKQVFIYSSFVLPINRTELENDTANSLELLNKLKSEIRSNLIFIEQKEKGEELLDNLQSLKQSFDKKDSKQIEHLGLFTAIMTFIYGTIKGFEFIESAKQALYFALSYGFGLSSMIFVFFGIVRGWKEVFKFVLIPICCLFILALLYIFRDSIV